MNLRKFAVYFFAFFSIIFIIFFITFQEYSYNIPKNPAIRELSTLECDLNKEACSIKTDNENIIFKVSPRPIYPMQKYILTISGLKKRFQNLEVVFYGLNMYMGEIVAPLHENDGEFSAVFVLSSCVIDVMRYRAEIFDNKKSTGIYIDFDIKKR